MKADTMAATAWLGSLSNPAFDSTSGHLLAMDRANIDVAEFTTAGAFVRRYGGRRGAGPGEIRDLSGYSWDEHALFILDNGNRKTLRFDRRGSFQASFPTRRGYRGIAALGGDRLVFVPGSDGTAFDVYTREGKFLGGRGSEMDLPKCTEVGCERVERCFDCQLAVLGDSMLVVAEGVTPQLVLFDTTGARLEQVSFARFAFLNDWKDETRQRIREHADIRAPNQVELKTFFGNLTDLGNGRIAVAVIPARSYLSKYGHELWVLDVPPTQGSLLRFRYADIHAGADAAVTSTTVYAVNTGEVDRYAFPVASPTKSRSY